MFAESLQNYRLSSVMYELEYPFTSLRPREKLQSQGVGVLSNAELLALIINVGNRRESVMDLASRIIKDYGFSALANMTDYKRLAQHLNLSQLKAMQIIAVLELGRRLYLERLGKRVVMNTPQKVIAKFRFMADKEREELRVIYLNSRQMMVLTELISIGSIDFVRSQPRDILAPALEYAASGIILVHNHPSGEVQPSTADVSFTESLKRAATMLNVQLFDHIIIARKKYFSFQEGGLLTS